MNALDRIVAYISPAAGLRRIAARNVLAQYEAAIPSRLRKFYRDGASPNRLVQQGALGIRAQARALERNHDIARGALRTLVNNVVGPNGIGIEPQPRRADGTIHDEYAAALREAYRNWCRVPEVTQRHPWSSTQRLLAKTWFRDGEAFSQMLLGNVPKLNHGTTVPFSLEMFEPDMVPLHYSDNDRILQGIERNAWGQSVNYFVFKQNPLDQQNFVTAGDLRTIPAQRMLHLASLDRIGQLRGVSEFASVITRIEDLKDYEESERIAAKIAAALTAYVKKGQPELYQPQVDENGNATPRELKIAPGMIIDGLAQGEEIGLIDSKRPNPNLVAWRSGQLRAFACGVGASYSSVAKDYGGTFSSQRQELVEQFVNYAVLTDEFVGQIVQPVWETFVLIAHLSGVVPRPADVIESTADDALYIGQSMPWIDPLKEANAWLALVQAGFASEAEVIRRRGANPRDVLEQIDSWRKSAAEKGLKFSSDVANSQSANGAPANEPPPDEAGATGKQEG